MDQDSALALSIISETPIPYIKDNSIYVALGKVTFPAELFILLIHKHMYNVSLSTTTSYQLKKDFSPLIEKSFSSVYGDMGKWYYDLVYVNRSQEKWDEKVMSTLSDFCDEYAKQIEELDNRI